MGINKIVIGTTLGLLLLVSVIYMVAEKEVEEAQKAISSVKIEETWKLPKVLSEISGMTFLEDGRILGVQDESGILFIYNLNTRKIDEEIRFGEKGDYEGVAVLDTVAFVLMSNGIILKVENFKSTPKVSQMTTVFSSKDDTEGLCLDKTNNQLLIIPKEGSISGGKSKGIYAISLKDSQMKNSPIFEINFENPIFSKVRDKEIVDTFKPSEINIHPKTEEIFLLGGVNSQLLVLDPAGKPKDIYSLDKKFFPQPEGLAFDTSGNLFISSEGAPATIHRVTLN